MYRTLSQEMRAAAAAAHADARSHQLRTNSMDEELRGVLTAIEEERATVVRQRDNHKVCGPQKREDATWVVWSVAFDFRKPIEREHHSRSLLFTDCAGHGGLVPD